MANAALVDIQKDIQPALTTHNEFLKELGLEGPYSRPWLERHGNPSCEKGPLVGKENNDGVGVRRIGGDIAPW